MPEKQQRTSPPIRFEFNEEKATAAAAVLLKPSGRRMSYFKLIKLLYLAERRSLQRYGRPICGDDYVAMNHGPVMSIIYNLIKEEPGGQEFWLQHIRRQGYDVELVRDPGEGSLSEAETQILHEVFREYGHRDQWDIRDLTHAFPEWKDPKGSSTKISPEKILREGLSKSDDEIAAIAQETAEMNEIEALLRGDSCGVPF